MEIYLKNSFKCALPTRFCDSTQFPIESQVSEAISRQIEFRNDGAAPPAFRASPIDSGCCCDCRQLG